jgi:hypothetical protein
VRVVVAVGGSTTVQWPAHHKHDPGFCKLVTKVANTRNMIICSSIYLGQGRGG